ncbi:unnamed protein product, partial [Ectocarpus sp. 8 AP-2014]
KRPLKNCEKRTGCTNAGGNKEPELGLASTAGTAVVDRCKTDTSAAPTAERVAPESRSDLDVCSSASTSNNSSSISKRSGGSSFSSSNGSSNSGNGSSNSDSSSNSGNNNSRNSRNINVNSSDSSVLPPEMHKPPELHEQHQEQDEPPAASGFAPRTPSILVVDDSRISRQIAERSLSRAKFHVEVAPDGEVGLARLQAQPSSFDLILLDVVMPGLDGVEVLTRVKQDPRLGHIPVVMLSGLESDRLEELCLQQGAVVVLRKPLTAEKVIQVVDAC